MAIFFLVLLFPLQVVLAQDSLTVDKTSLDAVNNVGWVVKANNENDEANIAVDRLNTNTKGSIEGIEPKNTSADTIDIKDDQTLNKSPQYSNKTTQYQLKSGDSISVTVFGETDLNLSTTRIPQSGVISFPLIGPMEVVNKTTQEIEKLLISALSKGYINNPRLTVSIDSYRPIFIKGAVTKTGSFAFTEGLTVAQALSLAGGTTKTAKPFGVTVEREGRVILQSLSLNSNVEITSGDVLSIDEEIGYSDEDQFLYVYLHGEVNRPGEYKYRPGLTVEKAVVLAGGFSLRASKRKISVSRYIEDQEVPDIVKKVPLYLPVNPGDIINVGASWF